MAPITSDCGVTQPYIRGALDAVEYATGDSVKQPNTLVSCLFSCLLSLVCCLYSLVSCLLSVGCWLLSLVSCLLSPVSCLLSLVSCLLSLVSCLLSLVSCLLSTAAKSPVYSQSGTLPCLHSDADAGVVPRGLCTLQTTIWGARRAAAGATASNDTNQPQVLHTSTGTCTDKTCLMLGRAAPYELQALAIGNENCGGEGPSRSACGPQLHST